MGMHVDEPWGNNELPAVDLARGARGKAQTNLGDPVTRDCEVGLKARAAGSVDHNAASEDEVFIAAPDTDERWGAREQRQRGGDLRDECATFHETM